MSKATERFTATILVEAALLDHAVDAPGLPEEPDTDEESPARSENSCHEDEAVIDYVQAIEHLWGYCFMIHCCVCRAGFTGLCWHGGVGLKLGSHLQPSKAGCGAFNGNFQQGRIPH